jgi:hypothetical protein
MGTSCCNNTTEKSAFEEIKLHVVDGGCKSPTSCIKSGMDGTKIEDSKAMKFDEIYKAIAVRNAIKYVIRLQAWFRGIKSRKVNPKSTGLKPIVIIKYVGDQLKTRQETVKKVEKELGPYELDWDMKVNHERLELRKAVTDSEGAVYYGYWNIETNTKEGYGQQMFSNGSKYEGLWLNGEFEGKGRYIYDSGDYYIGEWKQGKVCGIGKFVGTDGIIYEGAWKDNVHHGKGIQRY